MKRAIAQILIAVWFISDTYSQTELVPNWNIEDLTPNGEPSPPCNIGNSVFRAIPWRGDYVLGTTDNFDGPQLFDTQGSVINGIDWCPGQAEFDPTAPENVNGWQEPRSGDRYLCLSSGFLERQYVYVPLNEPVYYGDIVDLKMYVSQADARNSLKFQVRLSGDTDWEPSDPTIYTGDANDKNNWVEHSATIAVAGPADEPTYCGPWNYLLIAGNAKATHSSMYIDDVSLKKTFDCFTQHDCIQRTGPIDLVFSQPHNADFPFCAIGCSNLSYIDMQIWSSNGSQIIWEFEMEYPPDRICWDGRTSSHYPVANATYEYRIYAQAFCSCSKEYSDNFLKLSQGPADDPDYYFNLPENGCPRPGSCCGDINQSLSVMGCDMYGFTEYRVQNVIDVDYSVVKNGADVSM